MWIVHILTAVKAYRTDDDDPGGFGDGAAGDSDGQDDSSGLEKQGAAVLEMHESVRPSIPPSLHPSIHPSKHPGNPYIRT